MSENEKKTKEEMNAQQVFRLDGNNTFVEIMSDWFDRGIVHLGFYKYDKKKAAGERYTDMVQAYLPFPEFLLLCERITSGNMMRLRKMRLEKKDNTPLYERFGGSSAETLAKFKKSRKDGMCLSRTMQIDAGTTMDFLLKAASGKGEKDEKTGLIVPRFGSKPEQSVLIATTAEKLMEFAHIGKAHVLAYVSACYTMQMMGLLPADNTVQYPDIEDDDAYGRDDIPA